MARGSLRARCALPVVTGMLAAAAVRFLVAATAATPHPVLLVDDFVSLNLAAWRVEQGQGVAGGGLSDADVLLEPTHPWEADVHAEGSVLIDPYDPGPARYKAFYCTVPDPTPPATGVPEATAGRMLATAWSADGLRWHRPQLDFVPYGNASLTNILMRMKGDAEISQISVLLSPHPSYRFEMFFLAPQLPPNFPASPRWEECEGARCLYRFHSADAVHWTPWEALPHSAFPNKGDGALIYLHPGADNNSSGAPAGYIAYMKVARPSGPSNLLPYASAPGVQRTIVQSTSADGSSWSTPLFVAQADWRDAQGDQFVGLLGSDGSAEGFTTADGHGVRIGLFNVFHQLGMTITTQFAVSRDGLSWWRPDRRPMVPLRPLGDYGGGLQWPMRTLTHDQDVDALHLYFSGTEGLHADMFSTRAAEDLAITKKLAEWEYSSRIAHLGPTTTYMADGAECSSEPGSAFLDCEQPYNILRSSIPFHGAMMRATWRDGRLWALVPASGGGVEGTATTKSFAVSGRLQLSLNFVAPRRGALRVAVQAPNGSAIVGFGRDDCVPLTTNGTAATVAWHGGAALPRDVQSVRLVFFLRRARLYGFRVSSSQHPRAKMDDESSLGLRLHRQRNHSLGPLTDLAPAISSNDADQCLKYLAVDGAGALEGYNGGPDTDDWTNLAFLAPDSGGEIPFGLVYRALHYGKSTMLNLHELSINACLVGLASAHSGMGRQRSDCVARWRAAWLGNDTLPGLWTAEFAGQWLASEHKLIGVHLGDELLSLGMTVSNLTAIVGIVKATWPEGVVYTNFARAAVIDPEWRDFAGEPFGTLGEQWHALDWMSYSSYQLNNQSWLQPEAEHRQLYPSMAPHQRVVLQAGGWGSTSGPRGGWRQFTDNCSDPAVASSCTTDPFSCVNSAVAPAPASLEGGLQYEVDLLLSKIGGRPCWTLAQYDAFNVEQADAISRWAARDGRVIGIVVWPWAEWLDVNYYPGMNAGLKTMPHAVAAWKEIGHRILSAPEPPPSCRAPSSPPSPYPPPPPPTARQVVQPGLRFITNFDSNASAQAGWTSFLLDFGPPAAEDPCAQNSYRNAHLMKCHLKGLQEVAVTKQTLNISTMFSFQSLWGDLVAINHTGKDGKPDPIGVGTLSPDAAHTIDDLLVSLQPFVNNGTITGIFIDDERTCYVGYQSHPWAFDIYINHTTSRIRALLGNRVLVYVNDCSSGWPEIPDGVDLVGIDGYSPGTNGSAEVAVVHNLLAPLWPMLKPHQGAMIVPGMIGCSPSSTIGGNQSFELQQEHLLQKLDGHMVWAKIEPRIAGFTMWHWNNYATNPDCGQAVCPGPERGCDWRWGASNFPKVVAKLRQIGQTILSHPDQASRHGDDQHALRDGDHAQHVRRDQEPLRELLGGDSRAGHALQLEP
eukprot:SAG22_NODE_5_length_41775_cov_111.520971_13_plen_1400_part_00